ncbi:hypothetical protein HUN08_07055 [Gordonia sp. X0973]|uniref:hypothetical protein n=1 Tax=Gordonia sp. X0973 TaxID=2742602 RepID=UPI000F54724D|nr:hypothetical protein [Gordonia sp. X0973]QKT06977.1 hypothetical protein HUN08_07055 [Gordonia sp. X0973]
MSTQDSDRGDRAATITCAVVAFLFCLGQALVLWSQSYGKEHAFVYIGLSLAATLVVIIALACLKRPLPRGLIRIICGVAAALAGIAAGVLIAAGVVDAHSSIIYVGLPILTLFFVVTGTIPRSARIGRRRGSNK